MVPVVALATIIGSGVAVGATKLTAAEQLAGRYTRSFLNGDISGRRYTTTDVVEILPIGNHKAYINFELNFFNGHMCHLSGVAEAEGPRLVYRETDPELATCRLHIERRGSKLTWRDTDGTCQNSYYCGARGNISSGGVPWSSRRQISNNRSRTLKSSYRSEQQTP